MTVQQAIDILKHGNNTDWNEFYKAIRIVVAELERYQEQDSAKKT